MFYIRLRFQYYLQCMQQKVYMWLKFKDSKHSNNTLCWKKNESPYLNVIDCSYCSYAVTATNDQPAYHYPVQCNVNNAAWLVAALQLFKLNMDPVTNTRKSKQKMFKVIDVQFIQNILILLGAKDLKLIDVARCKLGLYLAESRKHSIPPTNQIQNF